MMAPIAAYTMSKKVSSVGTEVLNLVHKGRNGEVEIPFLTRIYCSVEAIITVTWPVTPTTGAHVIDSADNEIGTTIICPAETWVEVAGMQKKISAALTGDVYVLAYYNGTAYNRPV